MPKAYPEINAADFTKITKDRLPHQEIETTLITMGGGGVAGNEFKNKIVKAAGWNKVRLSSYAGDPEMAAGAFNKIRVALAKTDKPEEILALVSK